VPSAALLLSLFFFIVPVTVTDIFPKIEQQTAKKLEDKQKGSKRDAWSRLLLL